MCSRLRALLAAGLFASACASPPRPPREDDRVPVPPTHPLMKAVPTGAVSVLYIDYARLRTAWKEALAAGTSASELRQRQGFVESEDVDHAVLVAVDAWGEENLGIYQGRFGEDALARSEIAAGRDLPAYRERPLWGDSQRSLCLIQAGRVALGPRAAVERAVDVAEGLGTSLVSAPWYRAANQALTRAWPAGIPVALELLVEVTPQMQTRFASVFPEAAKLTWFALRAGGRDDLHVVAVGQAATEADARAVVFALAQRTEALAMRPQLKVLGVSGVLEALRYDVTGTKAHVGLEIGTDAWQTLERRFAQILTFLQQRRQTQQDAAGARSGE